MVTKDDYSDPAVQACLSVMVELMTVLGEFREGIILVCGWVPYFLYPQSREEHTGSLDIDIAFDLNNISADSYGTILKLLKNKGIYKARNSPLYFIVILKIRMIILLG
jgi:hypothetical protein